jgi:hypothetical protein
VAPNVSLSLLTTPPGFSVSLYHPYLIKNARSLVASGNNKPGGPVITYVSTWTANQASHIMLARSGSFWVGLASFEGHSTARVAAPQVYALVDKNGDGVAEQLTVLKTGLFWPNGIAWRNNSLYVTGGCWRRWARATQPCMSARIKRA